MLRVHDDWLAVRAMAVASAVALLAGTPRLVRADEDLLELRQQHQVRYFQEHYTKTVHRIPMRDGVTLFTTIYAPKDTSQTYPFLMRRTPYGVAPYEEDEFPDYPWYLGPPQPMAEEGFIFVYQDVRGRFMSEGTFINMRPDLDQRANPQAVDESTDCYDTIDWLLKNVPNNNGRVGLWGISYPGFYAAASMIDAHPALKAVSPQAPIADWFFEDFHHHGTLYLAANFNFFASFGRPREGLYTDWLGGFDHGASDGYQFFLDLGPLPNVNKEYFHGEIAFWNACTEHPNYDAFWQSRNLLPHLKNIAPAVMTVGGWYDAQNLYGPLQIYRAIEQQDPDVFNVLVMGPWGHGDWERTEGEYVGNVHFGDRTSDAFQYRIQLPFFNHYLKGKAEPQLPEALVFETGANRWRQLDDWPPADLKEMCLYAGEDGRLTSTAPKSAAANGRGYDEYVSDPARPVPYSETISTDINEDYMTDDQRFAARRPDVLVYQSEPLEADLTLAGPLTAELWVSTSGTDSDWIVKVIDVYPPDKDDTPCVAAHLSLSGYQQMVRSESFRGRYRNSYEKPEPFVANEPACVRVPLLDVLHTFRAGHRVMIQIQSTWFPLIDRNPQTYVENIYQAEQKDFQPATQRVYHTPEYPTHLRFGVLEEQ